MSRTDGINLAETAEKIRWFRKRTGMSMATVADLLDVNRTTVQQWENGNSLPSLRNAIFLADMFNVYIEDLVIVDEDHQWYGETVVVNFKKINGGEE